MIRRTVRILIPSVEVRNSEIENENLLCIHGNATNDDVLIKAGIMNASNLITTLPSDADNLFVVLSARQLLRPSSLKVTSMF